MRSLLAVASSPGDDRRSRSRVYHLIVSCNQVSLDMEAFCFLMPSLLVMTHSITEARSICWQFHPPVQSVAYQGVKRLLSIIHYRNAQQMCYARMEALSTPRHVLSPAL